MSLIQIIILIILFGAVLRAILRFKEKAIKPNELLFWLGLWIIGGAIVLFPEISSRLASHLGVGRGADLVVYLALILIFYLIFRLMVATDRLDQDITKITSAIALKDIHTQEVPNLGSQIPNKSQICPFGTSPKGEQNPKS
jgi:hypothetical protein